MRKKVFKKVLTLLLAGVMAMGMLAGCGGEKPVSKTGESTSPTSKTESSVPEGTESKYKDYSAGFDKQVTIQIPVYDRAFEGWNVTENQYTKWVKQEFGDKYNVKVEYVAIGRSTEVADYMQMLSAGMAPNIIMHYDMPQAVNYYSEGAMQELDLEEIANYAPTYWANLGETIQTYGEMDGKNYFFFGERPTYYYNWVTLIRKDWVDKVGGKMPTNLEELNALAAQWKEAGLGTLGERLLQSGFTYYYGQIGNSVDAKELALYSDLNVAPFTWAPTKAYLKNLNYQYNNGLIDTEFYLKDEDAKIKADFVSGKTGTYAFYMASGTDTISSLLANDPGAEVETLSVWAGVPEGNNAYYYQYPPYGMIMGINSDSTEEERIAVWMFLDWMSQPENLFKFQNGVEGESYTLDDKGLAVPVADYAGEWKRSNNNNKDYWCLVVEAAVYESDELTYQARLKDLAPAGYERLIADSKKYVESQEQYGLINTAYTKTVEASQEYASDLKELWKQLYVKVATCPEADFEAEYEAACETYLKAGYQEILKEKESLYDAGNVK